MLSTFHYPLCYAMLRFACFLGFRYFLVLRIRKRSRIIDRTLLLIRDNLVRSAELSIEMYKVNTIPYALAKNCGDVKFFYWGYVVTPGQLIGIVDSFTVQLKHLHIS